MQINGNLNNGTQVFQENNNYASGEHRQNLNEIVEKPKKVGNIALAFLLEFISLVASILTIFSMRHQINIEGLSNKFTNYSICFYLLIIGIFVLFTIAVGKTIFELLYKKESGVFVRKNLIIYRIVLKKCPICGASSGGKIRIKFLHGRKYYVCNRDIDHRWKFEHYQINDMI